MKDRSQFPITLLEATPVVHFINNHKTSLIYNKSAPIGRAVVTVLLVFCSAALLAPGAALAGSQVPFMSGPTGNARENDSMEVGLKDDFAELVGRTVPAVVEIFSSQPLVLPEDDNGSDQSRQQPPQQIQIQTVGSGVIVTADGYILTTHHVVYQLPGIKVRLSNNRELEARIVGTDPQTDVAVLKVDAESLPTLALGSSSSIHLGELTFAIGNPFGLRQTATMGIVSATGRSGLGIHRYEDLIQTDAAVNPGSSGGALINRHGELIGIVTAGSTYSGVGFAIPVDMARTVMEQIVSYGRVTRGWIGATVQSTTPAMARLFGFEGEARGALVADVEVGSSAHRAGLMTGDIILEGDGKPISDGGAFELMVAAREPGSTLRMRVYRDGEEKELIATLAEEPGETQQYSRRTPSGCRPPLGLTVQSLRTEVADGTVRQETRGVLVIKVDPGSPAGMAQISEGDIIVEINRRSITNMHDFEAALPSTPTRPVLLLIERSGTRMFIIVDQPGPNC
jgi:serine protease Do